MKNTANTEAKPVQGELDLTEDNKVVAPATATVPKASNERTKDHPSPTGGLSKDVTVLTDSYHAMKGEGRTAPLSDGARWIIKCLLAAAPFPTKLVQDIVTAIGYDKPVGDYKGLMSDWAKPPKTPQARISTWIFEAMWIYTHSAAAEPKTAKELLVAIPKELPAAIKEAARALPGIKERNDWDTGELVDIDYVFVQYAQAMHTFAKLGSTEMTKVVKKVYDFAYARTMWEGKPLEGVEPFDNSITTLLGYFKRLTALAKEGKTPKKTKQMGSKLVEMWTMIDNIFSGSIEALCSVALHGKIDSEEFDRTRERAHQLLLAADAHKVTPVVDRSEELEKLLLEKDATIADLNKYIDSHLNKLQKDRP